MNPCKHYSSLRVTAGSKSTMSNYNVREDCSVFLFLTSNRDGCHKREKSINVDD